MSPDPTAEIKSDSAGNLSEQSEGHANIDLKTLTWVVPARVNTQKASYINEQLLQKGLSFQIEFVKKGSADESDYFDGVISMKDMGENADFISCVPGTVFDYPLYYEKMVQRDLFLPLETYLNGEAGQMLKEAYDKKVWDALTIDGHIYAVTVNYAVPWQKVVIFDPNIMEKYDIHPEAFGQPLWEWEIFLEKILEGEKGTSDFIPIEYPALTYMLPDYTPVSGGYFGVFIDETAEDPEAFSLFESEYVEKLWGTIRDFQVKGYIQTGAQFEDSEKEYSTAIQFNTIKSASYFKLNFSDRDYVEFGELIAENTLANDSIAIASWSKQSEEAFQLLSAIMTDPDLSNSLVLGKEGEDYSLQNGRAVSLGRMSNIVIEESLGNQFITHPMTWDPVNKKEDYPKVITQSQKSKIFGFRFDSVAVQAETDAVLKETIPIFYQFEDYYTQGLDDIKSRLNTAGMDILVKEINRQLNEWQKTQ